MKSEDFRKIADEFFKDAWTVLFQKNADYARTDDALDNFKSAARMLGMEPRQVWAVYFHKHVSALFRWARDGEVSSEDLRGRFMDVVNYSALGMGLMEELRQEAMYAKLTDKAG